MTFVAYMLLAFFGGFGLEALLKLEYPLLYAYTILPGTAMHEGCHYVMALLTGGDPGISIMPKVLQVEGHRFLLMGYVPFDGNEFNTAAISLAPLLLIPVPAFLCIYAQRTTSLATRIILLYLAMCTFTCFMPSSVDLNNVHEHPESAWFAALTLIPIFVLSVVVLRRAARKVQSES